MDFMRSPIEILPTRYHTFARYFVCGGTATVIHYSILTALVELVHLDETLSTAIGYTLSAVVHYTMSYHWAFKSTVAHHKATIRFVFVALTSLALTTATFWVFHEIVGLWYLLAQAVTTALILFFNFTLNSRFTFASR